MWWKLLVAKDFTIFASDGLTQGRRFGLLRSFRQDCRPQAWSMWLCCADGRVFGVYTALLWCCRIDGNIEFQMFWSHLEYQLIKLRTFSLIRKWLQSIFCAGLKSSRVILHFSKLSCIRIMNATFINRRTQGVTPYVLRLGILWKQTLFNRISFYKESFCYLIDCPAILENKKCSVHCMLHCMRKHTPSRPLICSGILCLVLITDHFNSTLIGPCYKVRNFQYFCCLFLFPHLHEIMI